MKKENPLLRIWTLGKSEHKRLSYSIIIALIGVLSGIIPYVSASQIIIGIINNTNQLDYYLLWCGIGFAGYFMRALLYNFALALSHKAAFSILKDIRFEILEKLPKLPLGTVIDTNSGKLKQIIVDQVESMETTLAHLLPEMTSNIVGPICVLIYLFILDWRMALLSLVSLPIGMIFMMSVMKGYSKDWEGAVQTTQAMNETIIEYIGGIEVIKTFNQGKYSYSKFSDRVTANASYYYNWMKRCQFNMSLAYSIAPTTLFTVLPIGWLLYINGSLTADVFLTCIILSLGLVTPLLAAMSFIDNLAKIGTTVASVDEFLNAEEQQHGIIPVKLTNADISLNNVSFGYHEETEILHNINLTIPTGSMTALVGPSGGGKSTIAKLIAGFWDVDSGTITLSGIDEKKIPLNQLYEQTAFVSQDNYLFDDTILENIRMGRISATNQEVKEVAKASGCDDFIKKLEHGYETKVGSGGTHLSGGERQRIAIARAMIKDAPIVILDEATAYIDPENEAIIQNSVAKLIQGKTIIVIAHRLSTIIDADQVVVVKDGQIESVGTHNLLLETCSLYNSMWQAHLGTKDGNVA